MATPVITSGLTPASQILERHVALFADKKIVISGDIQDSYPAFIQAEKVHIHCTQFHTYLALKKSARGEKTQFTLLPEPAFYQDMNTAIYYWPKNKSEAQFQLAYLLKNMPKQSDIFIVGENGTGVKSAETLLKDLGTIKKIDSARRCGLYHFNADGGFSFDLNAWWQDYQFTLSRDHNHERTNHNPIIIKSLPGVFSAKKLDVGSELLLTTLLDNRDLIKGDVLDMGCGAGVLGVVLGKLCDGINLTLADVSIAALESSKATLACNHVTNAKVVASDVFSNLTDKYQLIISNPPFHDGKQTSYVAVDTLIKQAKKHLKLNGHLCLVANAFLPYQSILADTFKQVAVLAETTKFKVYLASH
ncbi:16S rRNA (guanine(1207)-N(2))-methyltransferase RsmC [Orbaceae bacterium ESL0727]|nr:16S rRNA (guanine(1207)-N(2))-methyltransferase RsmC [Orbaceae bacterium ESL0727]